MEQARQPAPKELLRNSFLNWFLLWLFSFFHGAGSAACSIKSHLEHLFFY
jgi:hypothetical protein